MENGDIEGCVPVFSDLGERNSFPLMGSKVGVGEDSEEEDKGKDEEDWGVTSPASMGPKVMDMKENGEKSYPSMCDSVIGDAKSYCEEDNIGTETLSDEIKDNEQGNAASSQPQLQEMGESKLEPITTSEEEESVDGEVDSEGGKNRVRMPNAMKKGVPIHNLGLRTKKRATKSGLKVFDQWSQPPNLLSVSLNVATDYSDIISGSVLNPGCLDNDKVKQDGECGIPKVLDSMPQPRGAAQSSWANVVATNGIPRSDGRGVFSIWNYYFQFGNAARRMAISRCITPDLVA
ncbi:hypothetical protein U1Q18_014545 [Sarracenia purpurea var. burkii]